MHKIDLYATNLDMADLTSSFPKQLTDCTFWWSPNLDAAWCSWNDFVLNWKMPPMKTLCKIQHII